HLQPLRERQRVTGFLAKFERFEQPRHETEPMLDQAGGAFGDDQDQKEPAVQQRQLQLALEPKRRKRQKEAKARDRIEDQHSALSRKAEFHQPMVDVLAVGPEQRQALQSAAQQRQHDVRNRQRQRKERRNQSGGDRAFTRVMN